MTPRYSPPGVPAFAGTRLLRSRHRRVAAGALGGGDDRLGDGALVDHLSPRIAGDRAGAERGAVAAGIVQHRALALAARRRAAEQGFERLRAGVGPLRHSLAAARRRQRIIGGDDERLVAGDGELVGPLPSGDSAGAAAGQQQGGHGGAKAELHDTHFHFSSWGAFRSRVSSARTSNSRTPMVMAASPTLKTKKGWTSPKCRSAKSRT